MSHTFKIQSLIIKIQLMAQLMCYAAHYHNDFNNSAFINCITFYAGEKILILRLGPFCSNSIVAYCVKLLLFYL